MDKLQQLQQYISHGFTALFHFLHGGFLTAGIIVTLVISGAAGYGNLHDSRVGDHIREWGSKTGLMTSNAAATEVLPESGNRLAPEFQGVADHLAKRYRVARPAVKEIVGHAHQTAKAAGLDPLLILAVISIESGFNPYAESVFNAQGLMQIIGKYHPEKFDQTENEQALLDPATNIRVGVAIIKEYLHRTGSMDAALQMYAGAPDDGDFVYSNKVIAEHNRLEQIFQRSKSAARS